MTTLEFLAEVRGRGIELWVEGEKLRYRAPRGALPPALRDELKRRRGEVLDFLRAATHAPPAMPPIVPQPRGVDDPLPLSIPQQRLWLIAELEPGNPAYNLPQADRLRGPLDVAALERSFHEIVRRHEVFRACFRRSGGRPMQVILPRLRPTLPVIDLRRLPLAVREDEIRRLAAAEARRPFDLTQTPLIRMSLLAAAPQEHVVLCNMHHIVSDGWSMAVFRNELAQLYQAFCRGADPDATLPALPVQYADFACWQRQWLSGEVLTGQLAYWKEQLAGAPHRLELPTDRPRPAVQSFRGDHLELRFSPELSAALAAFSRRRGMTFFMTLLAGFQALLGRHSGQRDLVVGSPIAGRQRKEIEGLIGFFVNTLVLRARLDPDQSFEAFLKQVERTALAAYDHQDFPFDKLVEELYRERDLSQNPIFQVVFALQNVPQPELEVADLKIVPLATFPGTAMFDLTLFLYETPDGLLGTLEYATDLFDATTVHRLVAHLENLLADAVADPGRRLAELALLSPPERHQLVVEWNETRAYDRRPSLADLFVEQAARSPEAVALVGEGAALSYRELDRRTGRLAAALAGLGVGPEVRVGLCVERSLELVVGVLAIVRAGGAYVPLDPAEPRPRLEYKLRDAGAGILITEGDLAAELPADLEVIRLDGEWPAPAPRWRPPALAAEHAAYVIYTSGSTGEPKGVVVTHGNVVRLLGATEAWFHFGPRDVWTLFHSYAFDFSVWEIWGSLLTGGRLVVVPYWTSRSPETFHRLLEDERVSVLNQTPSAFRQLQAVDAAAPGGLRGLGWVIFGGEELDLASLGPWLDRHGERTPLLVNMYGITETTVHVTYLPVLRPLTEGPSAGSAVGVPIPDLEVHLLGPGMEPVAIGVVGELLVGGEGLARGYHDRPALTAERFVPDPWSRRPGGRLYRSGDLARRLADGSLEYLGRADQQVQIRGFRVEPGEVASVLGRQPGVSEAVVVARRDGPADGGGGDLRLVAYVVPEAGVELGARDLRSAAGELLPAHMVPAAVVFLDALPLTANGKLDRRALPAPELDAGGGEGRVPRDPREEILAALFSRVLGRGAVGIDDDFFELGGHSLLATQLVSRVSQALEIDLPVSVVFEWPTVAGLAEHLGAAVGIEPPPPLRPVPRSGPPPLSFAQQRLWFIARLEPDSPEYNLPTALFIDGSLDAARLEASFAALVERHEALRTRFVEVGGQPVQQIDPEAGFSLPRLDLGRLPRPRRERELRRLVAGDGRRPFDLARGPLLRATLVMLAPAEHALLLNQHHIVSDGWSSSILIRELGAFYGGAATLPELPIQYADFAVWQRQWLDGEVRERQLAYWRERLDGAALVLELPTDRPRPAVRSTRGAQQPLRLSAALARELESLSRGSSVTLFMTLMAAFQAVLGRTAGQRDFLVGTPIAGRRRRELEGLIGFFVNTLVLRAELDSDPSFEELLARVRTAALGAYAHQDLPFEQLVEALDPPRDRSRTPLFQVMFVLQNAPAEELEVADLTFCPFAAGTGTAKCDLILTLAEGEDLEGALEYDVALFDGTTIDRLAGHLGTLLAAVAAEPETPVSALPILTPGERQQLTSEWSEEPAPRLVEASLQQLFEAQVERSDDALAVVYGEETLTYLELNEAANRLAHRLRSLGLRLEDRVGFCLERSANLVVAMVGIVKAGAAYVPLDPGDPPTRLAYLAADAGISVVVAEEELAAERQPALPTVEWLLLDREASPAGPVENPPQLSDGGSLAYVIFTSGSTGEPKGVEVVHRAISRLALDTEYVRLSAGDRVGQAATATFDAATFEVWAPLLTGGVVVGIAKELALTPEALGEHLRATGVDTLFLTTALFNQIVRQAPSAFATLRDVLFGGEAADPGAVRELLAGSPPARLLHVYGPTEVTTFATWLRVESVEEGARTVAIGRPLAHTRSWVVDRGFVPVPAGVVGELVLGGEGVMRGYQRRPGLTAEQLVPDPFSGRPGARLYRTGDLVRQRADGTIEFVGRRDFQVKMRGFRIELGEIATALTEQPEVREAVVLAPQGEGGERDRRLVGYAVAEDGAELDAVALRRALGERLPPYMVPSALVCLEAFPLNPNGKVDRQALARLELPAFEADAESRVAPRDPREEILAGIWAQVLGREVGVEDNFFDLGGHSLLATQLVSRVRQVLEVDLPVSAVFEQPTVAGFARHLDAAAGGEPQARRAPAPGARPLLPLRPVPRSGPPPLSFAQQRLWFIAQLEPDNPEYNMPAALAIDGPLDAALLERSFAALVERHEVLRTRFAEVDGRPVQIIDPEPGFSLPRVDLGRLPGSRREVELQRLALASARRPFDLARGPLLAATLVELAPLAQALLLNQHHIVSDGWSLGVLVRELGALYGGAALPELPIQYADYAIWQRRWLAEEVQEAQIAYWRERLAGTSMVLELPTDRPRPAVRSARGAVRSLRLRRSLAGELEALSRGSGTTMFMVLMAGFQALLQRTTGQRDFLVGTPIAGRRHLELEGLIGFFVNTLVLRAELDCDPSFGEVLARVRRTALGAYAHQDLPFEQLVEALDPPRDRSRTPLYQVMFAFQNAPAGELEVADLTFRPFAAGTGAAKCDLILTLAEGSGLEGSIEYDVALFDGTTIDRLAGHLATLLEAAAADPATRLSALPILTPGERQQVVSEWNATASAYPRGAGVHQLFEACAERAPEAVAVTCEEPGVGVHHLSYRDLDRRANRLARYLRRSGVRAEDRVGLAMERSPEMVVGILGILKAGAAYVPLDPGYPEARLAFLLADTQAAAVLTQESLAGRLPPGAAEVVCLESEWEAVALERGDDPGIAVAPDSLCYVMYTSGTTGTPKGVAVPHRAVVRLVRETDYADLSAGEVFFQLASISFDAATLELWGALANGARVVLPAAGRVSLAELGESLRRHRVSTLWLTAGLFHQMVEDQLHGLAGVRQLLAGGDVLSVPHVRRVLEELPDCRLINGYGPTENTTFTCCGQLREMAWEGASVPIGRPIANTGIRLLDRNLQPVPSGVVGELYAAGDGLARGYFRRPALTAEAFVPDPLGTAPGSRLYRTGDLARYLPDGNVEFLGRGDAQMKVRGFRIEAEEIEAALVEHPLVRAAVVGLWGEVAGDRQLVAWLVPDESGATGAQLEVSALRSFLKERVPDYMVPARFAELSALPLTPNGKVDRRALARMELPAFEADAGSRVAPRDPREEILAGIWAQVLGREVGVEDDFFELGGHSLLATQLISRVREALEVDLPVSAVFEQPTVAGFARHLDAATGGPQGALLPLEPAERRDALPLSFAQQRLWFIAQLEPDSPEYNLPTALRLDGPVDAALLERSLAALVERHESLRTRFAEAGEGAVQIIDPAGAFPLPRVDLRGLPGPRREVELGRLAAADARRPFDLARGPLLRATLVELAPGETALLLNQHHIISDGWSLGVSIRELGEIYRACAAGEAPALPTLPIQYADYAVWQRRWFRDDVEEAQLDYWRRQLAGAQMVLELPTDRPRPAVRSTRGDVRALRLPGPLAGELEALSRDTGATLFMTLMAGFQALLQRTAGQRDFLVGTPIAGRRHLELEGLVGFFVNTLALRAELGSDPSFTDLVARVRRSALGAYAHQDLPFERLVEALDPPRDRSRTPLFQVMFALQNMSFERLELPELRLSTLDLGSGTAKFDLSLTLAAGEEGLAGSMEYSTDLFDPTTIDRLGRHLATLLAAAAAAPETPLSALPVLSAGERHQLLGEWNDTDAADPGAEAGLYQLFAAQAERTPEAVALWSEAGALCYRELARRANRLAWHLHAAGVGPDVPVALLIERSPEMVVGIFAILAAGGAYLPLDPEYPPRRLATMVATARSPVLLTRSEHLSRVPETGAKTVCFDRDAAAIATRPATPTAAAVTGDHLAYVLFTSGSTGQPKGVMIPHRAIVNHMLWMADRLPLDRDDRVLQKTPFSFDASVWEFQAPLEAGACLVVAPPGVHRDGAAMVDLVRRQRVTILQLVPAQLQAVLEEPDFERCTTLRRVFAGGEVLGADLVRRFFGRTPCAPTGHVELHNLYGPTEAAIDATSERCAPTVAGASAAIGRPIANLRVHLLDRGLRPVPAGVPGELCITGEGLARGYFGSPALTAEAFVPDPLRETPGQRLYKTGDLARRLPTGSIEVLGRFDHQVKIRGFRIELGEIEAVLGEHPGLREAAVVSRTGERTGPRLVAWCVARQEDVDPEAGRLARELRELAGRRLPAYMVPAHFEVVDALPRNPSGKVDRAVLARRPLAASLDRPYAALRTPEEEVLAAIWGSVLGAERVAAADSFFDLGGHSLLATRVVSRVREAFAVELPVAEIFQSPTLGEQAAAIAALRRQASGQVLPPLEATPRALGGRTALELSFAQQRLWFLDRLESGSVEYNIPLALAVRGRLLGAALERSLAEIVRRHQVLRTRFAEVDGRPVQIVDPPGPVPLPRIDLGGLPPARREAEVLRLGSAAARQPFDLARGPLVRAALLMVAADQHVLLLNVHHIVFDAWSLGILIRELGVLYRATAGGEPSPLPELPVQYADYAAWQRRWLTEEVLAGQVDYWREQLTGAPSALELPTDRPRPTRRSVRGAHRTLRLSGELGRSLEGLSRERQSTLFMTLLAAFMVLLHRHSGQRDVVVGSPIAGRRQTETEGLIGFFLNTLVMRARCSAEEPFTELLERVRATALEAYAHQDLPFEQLVEALDPPRDRSRTPLFQVAFTLEGSAAEAVTLPGLTLEPLGFESGTSKFDLALVLAAREGEIGGTVEYSAELFDGTTIDRLTAHFETLLAAVAAAPETPLAALPLLSAGERQQLLGEWNDTETDYPLGSSLDRWIAEQVARTPDAVALVYDRASLSYRELWRRAAGLGRRLRALGVGPEVRVGIFAERSLEMVIGLVAILRAGGAYVPLDPEYPRERLAAMVEDSEVPVLLTQEHLVAELPDHRARVVVLDGAPEVAGGGELASGARPDNLAYAIFTSGSTGRPKGAMNSHRAIVNRLLWMQRAYGLGAGDRVLQKTPFSFDVSVWEFFWPLMTGAGLVVARPGGHRDGAYLVRRIVGERITTLHFVPSMLQAFLEQPGVEACRSLRRVIASGEALSYELEQRYYARLPCPLHNLYGPTEAAVDVTFHPCERSGPAGIVPIGRPIDNLRIHLVDRGLRPVPVGVAGELMIGGVGLARGYLGRPALTAATFVPDPLSATPGGRLYKSGDLTRHLPAGAVDYLGRLDHQVKIRGLRIELGEIEAVLGSHPLVQEAVVVAPEDERGDRRLVAFCVPDEHRALPLRRLLALEREGELDGRRPVHLADGTPVLAANAGEAEFVFQEIFEDRSYLRHGVDLAAGDCVFDVGANIGLFSLFVAREVGEAEIYAFEPIPAVFDLLRLNARLWDLGARLFACGLSDAPGQAEFTYYPHVSILSGRFADAAEERRAVRSFLENERAVTDEELSEELIEELLAERLESEQVTAELRTISQVMAEEGVERIDLLKVDVEKAELEVLRGIAEDDWPKIRQVVVEVHDRDGRRLAITSMLAERGFEVATDQDRLLQGSDLHSLYARRPSESLATLWREPKSSAASRSHRARSGEVETAEEKSLAEQAEVPTASVEHRAQMTAAGPPRDGASQIGDPQALVAELEVFAGDKLPDYMVPQLLLIDRLPLSPNGKADRAALGRLALESGRRDPAQEYVAPRDTLELKLATIWEELLGIHPIGIRDDFFRLGGHSLAAVRLTARIQQQLGRELTLTTIFQGATIERLAALLRPRRTEDIPGEDAPPAGSLVAIRPTGSRRPLFCVHPAGGNVLAFVPLAEGLGEDRPFYALQSRGLEGGAEPHTRVEAMAADYLAEVRQVQPAGPYLLAGWSFGGLVAFEMARQLSADGEDVALLALLDTHPPAAEVEIDEGRYGDDAAWLADVAEFVARLAGRTPELPYDDLRPLPPAEQVRRFLDYLQRIDFLPPGTGETQVRRLLEVYKANERAALSYQPRAYDGGVTLLRAEEGIEEGADLDLGWGRLVGGAVEVVTVPGDHVTLFARPHVEVLAERLRACLEQAEPGESSE